jgi:hypothetical protein
VHGASQHVQLQEHSLVCDLLSHSFIDDDLRLEQDPAEAVLQILFLQLGFMEEQV